MTAVLEALLVLALVVTEVAVWQLRVAVATRGHKTSAAALGAVNAVLSVVALALVVNQLDRPWNAAGYAAGVAAGVYLGVLLDQRLAREPLEFRVLIPGDATAAVSGLRARGWTVLRQSVETADGADGRASVLLVVVDASRAADLTADLDRLVPHGLRTSSRLRSASSVAA